MLVKRDATNEDRAQALKHAAAFGLEVTRLIESLPEEMPLPDSGRPAVVDPHRSFPPPPGARRPVVVDGVIFSSSIVLHRSLWSTVFRERLSHHAPLGITWPRLPHRGCVFQANFRLRPQRLAQPALNRLFLIHKGELRSAAKAEAFRWPVGGPYPAGVTFVDRRSGMPATATRIDHGLLRQRHCGGYRQNSEPQGLPT